MHASMRVQASLMLAMAMATACAAPASQPTAASAPAGARPVTKTINAAAMGTVVTVSTMLAVAGAQSNIPGSAELEKLVNAGLAVEQRQGQAAPLVAQLAQAVPTTDDGSWQVLPDGRMEMTWHLRPGVRWQDGATFSADDLVFTAAVLGDPDLPIAHDLKLGYIAGIQAPDPQTVVVDWNRPFIQADTLFSSDGTMPMPRHLLEASYQADKAGFPQLPFWSSAFVGTGPFKIQEWVDGTRAELIADPDYVLGRPKVDQITVEFIPDSGALLAAVLAGTVDLTLGRNLSEDEAAQVRDRWRDGSVLLVPANPNIVTPQTVDAQPPIVTNVAFRKALMHALDRQQLAAALTAGMGAVADSPLPMGSTDDPEVESAVVRYDYDPRAAIQAIEGLGFSRGADGIFRDERNQPLELELRALDKGNNFPTVLSMADYWKQVGVAIDPVAIPVARQADVEYRNTFPALDLGGSFATTLDNLDTLRAAEIPSAANGYRGRNHGRYENEELESLVDRYLVTIPLGDRNRVLASIVHTITDQVVVMYLFYDVNVQLVGSRLANVRSEYFGNAEQWDVQS